MEDLLAEFQVSHNKEIKLICTQVCRKIKINFALWLIGLTETKTSVIMLLIG